MKRLKTLRVRFALWVTGLLMAVLAGFGAFVYFSLGQALAASVDESLQLSASQAVAAVEIENGHLGFSDSLTAGPADAIGRDLTIRVLDPNGQVFQAFGEFRDLPISVASLSAAQQRRPVFETLADPAENVPVRFYTVPIVKNDQMVGIVQVAQDLDGVQKTLRRLVQVFLVGGPALVLIAAFGGYFLAARALSPIDHITRTARQIAGGADLSARLNLPPTEDEVGRLSATLDGMLSRLDNSFRRERRFTADASHELRTPLASMQAILSVVRAERRAPEDYEQAFADLSEETDRLRSLVEDLLRLARSDARQLGPRETVNLPALLGDVTESLRPLAEAKGLALLCDAPDGLTVSGESDELIRLFVNLVDNAVTYTQRGAITVTARADARAIRVTVSDTGIGIPAEHLPHIFDRFYRVDTSRASRGAGLGLAIAQDIVLAHGGSIEAQSSDGAGAAFVVRLPKG